MSAKRNERTIQEQKQKPSSIDILREQVSLLSDEMIKLEKEHKKLVEIRMGILRDDASFDTVLEELKKNVEELKNCVEKFKNYVEELKKNVEELKKYKEEILKKHEDFYALYAKTLGLIEAGLLNSERMRDNVKILRGQIEIISWVIIFVYEGKTQAELYFEDLEDKEIIFEAIRMIVE